MSSLHYFNNNNINATHFDAIVIGSGISGGWAAKELCEKGLKTLVIERGRKVEHIKDAIFYLQGSGIKTVAATEKTDQNIYDIDLKEGVAIIMGSEDRGINPSVLKIVDEKAKLPMFGTIGSLNVSVACGAFLYEAVRQRT